MGSSDKVLLGLAAAFSLGGGSSSSRKRRKHKRLGSLLQFEIVNTGGKIPFSLVQIAKNTSGASPVTSLSCTFGSNVPVGHKVIVAATYSSGNTNAISVAFVDSANNTWTTQAAKSPGDQSYSIIASSLISNAGTLTISFNVTTTGSGAIEIAAYDCVGLASSTATATGTYQASSGTMTLSGSGSISVACMTDSGSASSFTNSGGTIEENNGVNGGGIVGHNVSSITQGNSVSTTGAWAYFA